MELGNGGGNERLVSGDRKLNAVLDTQLRRADVDPAQLTASGRQRETVEHGRTEANLDVLRFGEGRDDRLIKIEHKQYIALRIAKRQRSFLLRPLPFQACARVADLCLMPSLFEYDE